MPAVKGHPSTSNFNTTTGGEGGDENDGEHVGCILQWHRWGDFTYKDWQKRNIVICLIKLIEDIEKSKKAELTN